MNHIAALCMHADCISFVRTNVVSALEGLLMSLGQIFASIFQMSDSVLVMPSLLHCALATVHEPCRCCPPVWMSWQSNVSNVLVKCDFWPHVETMGAVDLNSNAICTACRFELAKLQQDENRIKHIWKYLPHCTWT